MQRVVLTMAAAAAAVWAADLPVREVVLYKHGVGYFERSGRLNPGESARLDFKASEMDDVLKSLTLEEKGGGRIAGLRYDASEAPSRRLAEFPFQIGRNEPLSAVLDQLKGARIELDFGAQTVAGAIVSARLSPGSDERPEREQITLLLDGGNLRTLDLGAASAVRFPDPALQAQFQEYLAALHGLRSREERSVYIDSTDAGAREITAGYMIPIPVWKSSYRLIFPETGPPMLEGWAIVDNTTGEDWTNVRLALVSGRPVSFVSRLYEPRHVTRQTAELPEERAMNPAVHDSAVALAAPPAPAPEQAFTARAGMAAQAQARKAAPSTIAATADAREAGELFEYRIPTPVTVRKSQSAMLPFLQQRVEARKLLIYADPAAAHPLNAAEINNSTGKTLDGGPVTIYDGGVYGGEGLFGTLKAGDKRLISYALDLGTHITTAFDSRSDTVRGVRAGRGVLTVRIARVETRTYTIRNADQKPKTLVIEHAARPGYTLIGRKPTEKTATAYRFEVALAPGATETFPVSEERLVENSVTIATMAPDALLAHVRNANLSPQARRQLEEIADRMRQKAAAESEMKSLEARMAEISRDQQRIRQNIESLNRVSGQQQQVQDYARRLAEQEGELAGLRDKAAEARKRREALEEELAKLIAAAEF